MTTLTCIEICEIIKVCAQSGVREIQLSEHVRILFGSTPIGSEHSPASNPIEPERLPENFTPIHLTERAFSPELENEKEDLEELKISDPVKYEELLAEGELIDESDIREEQERKNTEDRGFEPTL